MTSVLRSAPAAPMLTSFTIQATLSPLTDQQAGRYPLGPAPPISRRSLGSPSKQDRDEFAALRPGLIEIIADQVRLGAHAVAASRLFLAVPASAIDFGAD